MDLLRRTGVALGVLAVLAVPVACGGDTSAVSAALPAELANQLAERSDEAAAQLDAGDACGAQQTLAALRAELERASSADDVPEGIGEQIEAALDRLDGLVTCAPAPAPEPEPEPEPKPAPTMPTMPTTPTTTQPPPPAEGGDTGP
jgi:hypothetical protein